MITIPFRKFPMNRKNVTDKITIISYRFGNKISDEDVTIKAMDTDSLLICLRNLVLEHGCDEVQISSASKKSMFFSCNILPSRNGEKSFIVVITRGMPTVKVKIRGGGLSSNEFRDNYAHLLTGLILNGGQFPISYRRRIKYAINCGGRPSDGRALDEGRKYKARGRKIRVDEPHRGSRRTGIYAIAEENELALSRERVA